jgi:hypothetical protein
MYMCHIIIHLEAKFFTARGEYVSHHHMYMCRIIIHLEAKFFTARGDGSALTTAAFAQHYNPCIVCMCVCV